MHLIYWFLFCAAVSLVIYFIQWLTEGFNYSSNYPETQASRENSKHLSHIQKLEDDLSGKTAQDEKDQMKKLGEVTLTRIIMNKFFR